MSAFLRFTRLASLPALLVVLTGCGPSDPAAKTSATSPLEPDFIAGKKTFTLVCATCHQANGLGVPGVFPPLSGSPIVAEADPGKLIRIVLHGLQGPIEVKGQTYNSIMPAQGSQLKDEEIANVLSYIRSIYGGDAPPVTAKQVSVVRLAVKRDQPWTWAELTAP